MKKFLILFCLIILSLSVRGLKGNPTTEDLMSNKWQINGPFELSPERGRFALTYSSIENKSFIFSLPLAKFAAPDVGYINNNYVSIFDPGVSLLILPGYILGKYFGISQVGAFGIISLFAITNVFLIYIIAKQLKASKPMAALAGLTFIFGTPAFTYGTILYQHHITTFLILSSILLIIKWKGLWSTFLIWLFYALAIATDYPNGLIMLPIVIYVITKTFNFKEVKEKLIVKVKFSYLLSMLIIILPISMLMFFNQMSYDNPFKLSGFTDRALEIKQNGEPVFSINNNFENLRPVVVINEEKSIVNFFKTRNLLNGLYILFLSPDRGIINYAPVIIFGILGLILFPIKKRFLAIMYGVLLINIVLYAMWGDVWGGWAFGSRYLIPSYAILSIFLAIFLSNTKKRTIILIAFFLVFSYSAFVNTAGALTTIRLPPQIEILNLEKITGRPEKYNYYKNFDDLSSNRSKSFAYNTFLSEKISAWQYFWLIFGLIEITVFLILVNFFINKNYDRNKI